MHKKIKTLRKNLLRFKTSEKKKSEKNIRLHRYSNRYLLTHVIHWYPRGTSFKKKKKKEKNSTSISVCWRQEWWVNRAILTGLVFSRESELSELCRLADCCMWLSFPLDKSFFKTRHLSGRGWFRDSIRPTSWRQMLLLRWFFSNWI